MRVSRPNIAPPLVAETPGEVNHRPGAMLSAGSQTVLPTVRFSPATTVSLTAAANIRHSDPAWRRGAAAAMARLQSSPPNALPDLLKLLRSPDASAKIAALAANEYLPP